MGKSELKVSFEVESWFECECEDLKEYRLEFDGGSSGSYFVDYCKKCYDDDDKQFLISMEVIP
ncbi:hypothetical protein [Nitrosopumilus sp.]|uniref:hypothetical protein n=1 Tax=Nitrosopumilus sp. TaxID=2024843 RepID=UPI003D1321E6